MPIKPIIRIEAKLDEKRIERIPTPSIVPIVTPTQLDEKRIESELFYPALNYVHAHLDEKRIESKTSFIRCLPSLRLLFSMKRGLKAKPPPPKNKECIGSR